MKFWVEGKGVYVLAALLTVIIGIIAVVVYQSPTKRRFLGNIVVPCVFIALAFFFAVIASGFPAEEAGPEIIPYLWCLLLAIFSGFILIRTWMGKAEPDPQSGRLDMLARFIGATLAYLIGMQLVGYYLTTFIFLVAVIYFLGYRKYVTLFAVAGGWVLFAYLVFQRMLYVPFPVGKLIEMLSD
ncbi:hypothetical protein U27_03463 [Candidatus Vecturithrix granuli]|uniref:DUF1468 domain-containing protein n=1 Tax=Vecturithrix granuli TaxID=1499967 RepID=A0A081BVZ6_VECG1|nr:hypothetical protein U27_03463 [Candidatus Vecturithrix granuli]